MKGLARVQVGDISCFPSSVPTSYHYRIEQGAKTAWDKSCTEVLQKVLKEKEDFLFLHFAYIVTGFFYILLSFFLFFVLCHLCVLLSERKRWPKEWPVYGSGSIYNLKYLECEEPFPWKCLVETKIEDSDWLCRVDCTANLNFVLLTDFCWDVIFLMWSTDGFFFLTFLSRAAKCLVNRDMDRIPSCIPEISKSISPPSSNSKVKLMYFGKQWVCIIQCC